MALVLVVADAVPGAVARALPRSVGGGHGDAPLVDAHLERDEESAGRCQTGVKMGVEKEEEKKR